jgi:hypothetical protein
MGATAQRGGTTMSRCQDRHRRPWQALWQHSLTMTRWRWHDTLSIGRRGCWRLRDIILRERTDKVGDKGGKKDKNKSQKQKKSKHDKHAKEKLDKQQAQKSQES